MAEKEREEQQENRHSAEEDRDRANALHGLDVVFPHGDAGERGTVVRFLALIRLLGL